LDIGIISGRAAHGFNPGSLATESEDTKVWTKPYLPELRDETPIRRIAAETYEPEEWRPVSRN
jgi:hypothetical protein